MLCPLNESWNTCAVPWKPVVMVAGRRSSRSSLDGVDRLAEREFGCKLNEMVTAGCWPWWLICSGPTDGTKCVDRRSGTDVPLVVLCRCG